MNTQRQWERSERKRRKQTLRRKGVTPAKEQYVYCVRTTAIAFPDWVAVRAVPGLASNQDQCWLGSRQLAELLFKEDAAEGGKPEVTRLKYRKCQVCGMYKLNLLADERRRLDESAIDGRETPCGTECVTRVRQQRGQI